MVDRPSDQALRRLLARLATEKAQDIRAILAELPASQRKQVEHLLATYSGHPAETHSEPGPGVAPAAIPEGVSPWLASRLQTQVGFDAGAGEAHFSADQDYMITSTAYDALKACAELMQPAPAAASINHATRKRPSLETFLGLGFLGRRAS